MNVDFPYHFDGRERTAEADEADHIRDLIEQILLTNPGERVNRPEFGAGLLQQVFAPARPEAAATMEFIIRGALQQNLGRRITVEEVEVSAEDSTLRIAITYVSQRSGRQQRAEFDIGGGGA
jgi:phage baseplate assembly protein W